MVGVGSLVMDNGRMALLGYGDSLETAKWLAGGSIISDKYVLTAAHVNNYSQTQRPFDERFARFRDLGGRGGLSGEPLLVERQFSTCIYTIIGITSFGSARCDKASLPDVFTRVAYYKPWIEEQVWG
ncbi:hypothetical protein HF086_016088 [Spodoptera exigua]|uniref:Peptidase S1 domain-containing protein n=1 Tax=Spodoptera exigua TaxID=7107 RepID=A0A922M584_SPOEX|nr:hypothetical protein HF086_016088 [Spodoptera exigua]